MSYEDNYRSRKDKSKCLVWNGSLSHLKRLPDDDIYGNNFYLKLPLDLLTNGKKYKGLLVISTVDVVVSS